MKILKITTKQDAAALFNELLEAYDTNWKSPVKPAWLVAWNTILIHDATVDELEEMLQGLNIEATITTAEI